MPLWWLLPDYLAPHEPGLMLAALGLAHLMDLAYPAHSGPMLKLHPTHTAFVMARRLAQRLPRSRLWGVLVWLAVMAVHTAAAAAALYTAWLAGKLVWLLVASYLVKVAIPLRMLLETAYKAYGAFTRGDETLARNLAQSLVRRNVWVLSAGHVRSAVIESVAENLVDAYVSPLLYYMLLGPLGAFAQRVVNSLDAALGYRVPQFREVGWLSARADDAVNYLPARLAALIIAAVSGRPASALNCVRRFAAFTPSPNAGYPISAVAGALNVVLEKPGSYKIGCGEGLPSPAHVKTCVELSLVAALTWLAAVMAVFVLPYLEPFR